jgi:hypothetical protein
MKEAPGSSETSVHTRATQLNISEDTILHSHRRENLKSYTFNVQRIGKKQPLCFKLFLERGLFEADDINRDSALFSTAIQPPSNVSSIYKYSIHLFVIWTSLVSPLCIGWTAVCRPLAGAFTATVNWIYRSSPLRTCFTGLAFFPFRPIRRLHFHDCSTYVYVNNRYSCIRVRKQH